MMRRMFGHTLVELVVSMAAGTTLMVLALGLVHESMTMSALSKERASHDRNSQRLVDQFRADVHRCETIECDSNGCRLTLANNHTVEYSIQDALVIRNESRKKQRDWREPYSMAKSYRVAMSVVDTADEALLEIRFSPAQTGYESRVDRRVTATIGRRKLMRQTSPAETDSDRSEESP
ncbi:hypothetical protein Pla52o_12320 [Novipirellula galeiformis]|uniref:Prepilin-type N-terminal cleavage/methylation domain-containing protein n=1 Tax=Novipirellula galeiformis TaxID=2528004 RepID=A0A5C6CLI1_9BACT|nr:hypothetical protein [Novipirellula galeiformis]TWU24935.1 hypothetical protein Pla52o_12320 [Novipirellula galeiformis]